MMYSNDAGANRSISPESLSKSEYAYQILREKIISGRYEPGMLLNIRELSEELRVSRTPIKDAINRLGYDGLVDIYPDRYAIVSRIDFADVIEILECREVENSRKLLCSQVKIGDKVVQICSGLRPQYTPEMMVGKKVMVITNLKPRKMAGLDSCGMLLSAIHSEEGEEKLHLLMVDDHIPAGAKLY